MHLKVFCVAFIFRLSLKASFGGLPWTSQPLIMVSGRGGRHLGLFLVQLGNLLFIWGLFLVQLRNLLFISGKRGMGNFLLYIWIHSTNSLSVCKSKSVMFAPFPLQAVSYTGHRILDQMSLQQTFAHLLAFAILFLMFPLLQDHLELLLQCSAFTAAWKMSSFLKIHCLSCTFILEGNQVLCFSCFGSVQRFRKKFFGICLYMLNS